MPRRIHFENETDNDGLFIDDFQPHSEDGGAAVLAAPSGVLNGGVPIAVTLTAGVVAGKKPSFLPAVNFVADTDDVLFVDKAVKDQR